MHARRTSEFACLLGSSDFQASRHRARASASARVLESLVHRIVIRHRRLIEFTTARRGCGVGAKFRRDATRRRSRASIISNGITHRRGARFTRNSLEKLNPGTYRVRAHIIYGGVWVQLTREMRAVENVSTNGNDNRRERGAGRTVWLTFSYFPASRCRN